MSTSMASAAARGVLTIVFGVDMISRCDDLPLVSVYIVVIVSHNNHFSAMYALGE